MSMLSIVTALLPGIIKQVLKVYFQLRHLKPESEVTLSTPMKELQLPCGQW